MVVEVGVDSPAAAADWTRGCSRSNNSAVHRAFGCSGRNKQLAAACPGRKVQCNVSCQEPFSLWGNVFVILFDEQWPENGSTQNGLTFTVLLSHIRCKAALRSTQSNEEVAHGEELVRRVVESQRAAELRALTRGVGLRVGEDEEIGHLVSRERQAAGETDRPVGHGLYNVVHLVPDLLPFRHGAQQCDSGPQPHFLRQRPWPLVSRLDADGATGGPVELFQLGIDGHSLPVGDAEVVVGVANEAEEGVGSGYHLVQWRMESPSPRNQ